VQQFSPIPVKRKPLDFERHGLLLAWAALIFGVLEPKTFLTAGNISIMLGSQAVLVIGALGLTVSLTVGEFEFDLSIANVLVSTSMVTALLNVNTGWPISLVVLAGLLVGVVVGFINGLFIVKFRTNSLIVTLDVGSVLRGLTSWIHQSTTFSGDVSTRSARSSRCTSWCPASPACFALAFPSSCRTCSMAVPLLIAVAVSQWLRSRAQRLSSGAGSGKGANK